MRNGFNQISLPYMNELTARAMGAASVFNGNTPVGYINFSLGRIGNFFQQKPDKVEPMPPGYDPSKELPYPAPSKKRIPSSGRTQADDVFSLPDYSRSRTPPIVPQASQCAWYDLICKANEIQNKPKTQEEANAQSMPKNPDGSPQTPTDQLEKLGANVLGIDAFGGRFLIVIIGVVLLIAALVSLR